MARGEPTQISIRWDKITERYVVYVRFEAVDIHPEDEEFYYKSCTFSTEKELIAYFSSVPIKKEMLFLSKLAGKAIHYDREET